MAAATLAELEADPHAFLARLRESEPVAWVDVLGAWLVTSRDLALQAMRDDQTFTVDDPRFSTGQVVGRSMLTTDGAEHERQRAPFARPWRKDAIQAVLGGPVEDEVARLIDAIEPDGAAEIRRAVAGPLAARMMAHALRLEDVEIGTLLAWYDAIVEATSGLAAGQPIPEAARNAAAELRARTRDVLSGDAAGGLAPDEVSSNAAVLLFGGIETTEGMICNALLHLLSNPGELELVRADPALLPAAIEESLRLEPAAASIDRYATRHAELGGAQIERGDLVTISLAAANRDPATFPDPDRFDVRRGNAARHISFAGGPHVCLGMHLARLEAHTALAQLLERLPDLRLDPDRPSAPRGLVFRKPPELNVLWG